MTPAVPPPVATAFKPIYAVDYEALAEHPRALDIAEKLSALCANVNFRRDRMCWSCEHWTSNAGLANLPFRPGVGVRAVESCSGCHLAYLDVVGDESRGGFSVPATRNVLRFQWTGLLQSRQRKANGKPYRRVLKWDSAADQQGFTGPRQGGRSSFSHAFFPANDTREHCACPSCGGNARVERYWSTGPTQAEPVRMVAIQCQATKCRARVVTSEERAQQRFTLTAPPGSTA